MTSMTDLDILIATHNGANVLKRTLEGYKALDTQSVKYRLHIVDNASTDDTPGIISAFQSDLPLNLLYEPRSGKNCAMNTGLSAIQSDIIIMSDDDSIPHPNFLHAWQSAFQAMPDIDAFGGSIIPLFDEKPAAWMLAQKPRFEELYAQRENLPAGPIDPDRIYGPNMAIRSSLLQAGLRFNEDIGPDATRKQTYAMGSETAFFRDVVSAGYKTGFAPEPTVSHIVRKTQISQDYIDGRAYRMGRGTAAKHCADGTFILKQRAPLISAAGHLKQAISSQFGQFKARLGSTERRFHARWNVNFSRGYQDEIAARKATILSRS